MRGLMELILPSQLPGHNEACVAAAVLQGWWRFPPHASARRIMTMRNGSVSKPSLTDALLHPLTCRRYTEESLQQPGVDALKGPDRAAVQARVTCC